MSDSARNLPLRIALVVESFVSGTGGVENVARAVAGELVRQGEDVTVVAREADAMEGVQLARTGGSDGGAGAGKARAGRWRRNPWRALAFSREANQVAERMTFDVVHAFSRTRRQDLFRAGGGAHEDYLRRTTAPLGRAYRQMLPRHRSLLALDRAVFADPSQRIQCASSLVADRLTLHHGVARERLLLLPNAVDAARFDPVRHAASANDLRRQHASGATSVWLFPASGWSRKGLDLALAALAIGDRADTRLWVAGRDDPAPWRRRAARAGLADRVVFLGPRADLETVYAAVDVVVLPTRYDPFANVTFEAAAAARPIVTTAANGAAEWLSDEARHVGPAPLPGREQETIAALAAALHACRDREHARRMGERARSEVLAYDGPSHVAALRTEYARIAEAKRARARGGRS